MLHIVHSVVQGTANQNLNLKHNAISPHAGPEWLSSKISNVGKDEEKRPGGLIHC